MQTGDYGVDILRQNKLTVFSFTVVFFIGAALSWIQWLSNVNLSTDVENLSIVVDNLPKLIQYLACVLLGSVLGFCARKTEAPMLVVTSRVTWRIALGWWILAAVVEFIFSGDSTLSIITFPSLMFQYMAILGAAFIGGNIAEGVANRRIRPEPATVWPAVIAITAIVALVLSTTEIIPWLTDRTKDGATIDAALPPLR